jgi:hypothetical protein
MPALPQEVLALVQKIPGLTDREITNRLRGNSAPQQPINIAARALAKRGRLLRKKRDDGLIGNFPSGRDEVSSLPPQAPRPSTSGTDQSEDRLKQWVQEWLRKDGWDVKVAWARARGIDIHAFQGGRTWIIEVKGIGSLSAMRVNYFLSVLGETLQRMGDPAAKYSICLPDVPQFRNLWARLPQLAKRRTGIGVLFVSATGGVTEAAE